MKDSSLRTIAAGLAAATLAGCNLTGAMDPPPAFPSGVSKAKPYVPASSAGLKVPVDPDSAKLAKLVAKRAVAGSFGIARSDPFALTTEERYFETQQATERLFGGVSGFSVQLSPKPPDPEDIATPEPQPYRRLSGIVVGDSVLAILEEEGREPIIITPGMQIPNSPWRVVSIDQDKAILRRSGTVKPKEIRVPLETPRGGTQAAAGAPGGYPGAPGGYPGGPPGVPPGGYPGAPGGGGRGD